MQLLQGQPGLVCCGEAGSIAATVVTVTDQKPDLVLLDLRLSDGEAFELIGVLARDFPTVRVLVLSQYDEQLYAEKALRSGAKGYVMKEAAADQLLAAVRLVLAGGIYLSPGMSARLPRAG